MGRPGNIRDLKLQTSFLPQIESTHSLRQKLSQYIPCEACCHVSFKTLLPVLVLFKIADFNFGKLNASPRIPKKRRPRSPKLSECGKRWKHPAKILRAVHALDAARYPFQRSQNLFLKVFGKDAEEDSKKRPLFCTAALAKYCFISVFPEEIKKYIGSVTVVKAKQSWLEFKFRQILIAVKAENFCKDSFIKEN